MTQNPVDSVDLELLLDDAVAELAKARENAEISRQRSNDNIRLLESVVQKLNHIKLRRLKEDSGIIH